MPTSSFQKKEEEENKKENPPPAPSIPGSWPVELSEGSSWHAVGERAASPLELNAPRRCSDELPVLGGRRRGPRRQTCFFLFLFWDGTWEPRRNAASISFLFVWRWEELALELERRTPRPVWYCHCSARKVVLSRIGNNCQQFYISLV
jgi:hypothetical protein